MTKPAKIEADELQPEPAPVSKALTLDAAEIYAAYAQRKALQSAVPPPSWEQLDDVERAAWMAAAAV